MAEQYTVTSILSLPLHPCEVLRYSIPEIHTSACGRYVAVASHDQIVRIHQKVGSGWRLAFRQVGSFTVHTIASWSRTKLAFANNDPPTLFIVERRDVTEVSVDGTALRSFMLPQPPNAVCCVNGRIVIAYDYSMQCHDIETFGVSWTRNDYISSSICASADGRNVFALQRCLHNVVDTIDPDTGDVLASVTIPESPDDVSFIDDVPGVVYTCPVYTKGDYHVPLNESAVKRRRTSDTTSSLTSSRIAMRIPVHHHRCMYVVFHDYGVYAHLPGEGVLFREEMTSHMMIVQDLWVLSKRCAWLKSCLGMS